MCGIVPPGANFTLIIHLYTNEMLVGLAADRKGFAAIRLGNHRSWPASKNASQSF